MAAEYSRRVGRASAEPSPGRPAACLGRRVRTPSRRRRPRRSRLGRLDATSVVGAASRCRSLAIARRAELGRPGRATARRASRSRRGRVGGLAGRSGRPCRAATAASSAALTPTWRTAGLARSARSRSVDHRLELARRHPLGAWCRRRRASVGCRLGVGGPAEGLVALGSVVLAASSMVRRSVIEGVLHCVGAYRRIGAHLATCSRPLQERLRDRRRPTTARRARRRAARPDRRRAGRHSSASGRPAGRCRPAPGRRRRPRAPRSAARCAKPLGHRDGLALRGRPGRRGRRSA